MNRGFLLVVFASLASCSGGGSSNDAGADVVSDIDLRPLAPLPSVEGLRELTDENPDPNIVEVHLTAAPAEVQLASGAMTRVLAYNGMVPGPLLHARVGDRVIVHFRNGLDETTTVHWHGLRISDQQDGSPRIQSPIPAGGTFTYDFVVPDAGTFWYHSHVNTIHQVERGLYGAIVVHERTPVVFNAERVFVLDDVRLDNSNQIGAFLTSGPDIGRGRLGNRLLCNGGAAPCRMTARRGAVERWRVVSAANARSLPLYIEGASFRLIATDGGFLPEPLEVSEVMLAPGNRYEFEVRFDSEADAAVLRAVIPVQTSGGAIQEQPFTMASVAIEGSTTPATPMYPRVELPSRTAVAPERPLALSGMLTDGGVQFTINGMWGGGHMHHGMLEQFRQGDPVRFTIRSDVSPEHPFHLHGQFFQIVARDGLETSAEPGLRDTVLVQGRSSVTILTYFENPGRWMYHCHISEHSELGMMGELEVTRR